MFARPPRHKHAHASNIFGGAPPPSLSLRNSFEMLPVRDGKVWFSPVLLGIFVN